MTEKVAEAIGRLWFEDWAGEPFENLDAESQARWVARAERVWEQVHSEAESDEDRCHGCGRELPDGTRRLMVSSFEGFRRWCEDLADLDAALADARNDGRREAVDELRDRLGHLISASENLADEAVCRSECASWLDDNCNCGLMGAKLAVDDAIREAQKAAAPRRPAR